MPKTPFDKVVPEYRSAVVPDSHWMSVCHPYFIPNQPPPPCGPCCHPVHPMPPQPPHCGCGPLLDKAPAPCGFHDSKPAKPVFDPLGHAVPVGPAARPQRQAEASARSPIDHDGLRQAPHPYVYWLAKREVNVAAGDNVDVTLAVDKATGDKTYTVSSHTPEEELKRIAALEKKLAAQLEEVRHIKENMLTVTEDDTEEGNGIVFEKGLDDGV